ncbi:MAG: uracil-DNA glycosylase [Bacteroidales bacterium]|nr:uracil-DNA glycosylase [Bacteroidales bacterium]
MKSQINANWFSFFQEEMQKEYFIKLMDFVGEERKNHLVFPPEDLMFNAFRLTSWDSIKVVILGQDPYHGDGQAHGLSFSVPKGIRKPPSLQNIFKELQDDVGIEIPPHGNLESWAKQGVLLLNACLTVRKQIPTSHQNKGWEIFTDVLIRKISEEKKNVVFMLWGRFAQQKASLINKNNHLILNAVHPSPMSVYRGFFGCKHFSQANRYLSSHSINPIDWNTVND